MLRSGLPHVCKTCLLSLHMKNISYLKNTVRMRNLFKNWPIWGIWDKTGTPQGLWIVRVCKRSPELTRQHGFMGVGHTPELLELKKPGTGDRDGLTRTHHRVAGAGVQMALIFFPLFFFPTWENAVVRRPTEQQDWLCRSGLWGKKGKKSNYWTGSF